MQAYEPTTQTSAPLKNPLPWARLLGHWASAQVHAEIFGMPGYGLTLQAANAEKLRSFTEVEQDAHQTDHGLIGALMARSWGVSQTVTLAIRLHHDYAIFQDPKVPDPVARLIAMGLVADLAIQTFAGMNNSNEWTKGGEKSLGALMLDDQDVEHWVERLNAGFSDGVV